MGHEQTIAIVGAGLVGSGWALVFARAGCAVRVFDPSPAVRDQVLPWANRSVLELADYDLVRSPSEVVKRIRVVATIEEALSGASYIQESAFETVEIKTEVSLAIDKAMSADAIVGSSSSGIPASKFTAGCVNRERFMIAHPVNPPHLVPVVEMVPAPWTEPAALQTAVDLMASTGQVPVVLAREIDGFVLNRLQGALLNEAWALYEDGIASLADIDATIAHGLGLRWSFMGPFETIDLNAPLGIADYASRFRAMYHGMQRDTPVAPWSEATVARAATERRAALPSQGLAERRAWRDGMLTKLSAFRKKNGVTFP